MHLLCPNPAWPVTQLFPTGDKRLACVSEFSHKELACVSLCHFAGGRAGLSASRRKRTQSRSPAIVPSGASDSHVARRLPVQPQEPDEAQPQPQAAPAALPAVTSWRKGPAAVQPPSGLEGSPLSGPYELVHAVISEQLFSLEMQYTLLGIHCWPNIAQRSFRAAGSVLRMTESPAAGALILSSADARTHAKRTAPEALGLVDAGLMAGHSFRVGWAPGGRLAHPGGGPQMLLPYMPVTYLWCMWFRWPTTLYRSGLRPISQHA